jgi:biopolymer transport protein ExbD
MRLIVNHPDFPFRRETGLARAVDVTVLLLLGALVVHAVRAPSAPSPQTAAAAEPVVRQVILTIHPDGRWTLAGRLVPPDDAEAEIGRVFADRSVKVLFVEAAAARPFAEVLAAAERARAAGIRTVGFLPPTGTSNRSR